VRFAEFRRLCLAMPGAEEVETWGEATFRVGGRIFAMGQVRGRRVSIKASLDDQAALVAMDPETFEAAAYTGRFGWVSVLLPRVGRELGDKLVRNAWERTAPRRLSAPKTRGGDNRGRRTAAR
jgi:predicted DNA-binding protein (MmcQ/YjbR family)